MSRLERGAAGLSAGLIFLSSTASVAVPDDSREAFEAPANVVEQAGETLRARDEMQESLDAASEAADADEKAGGQLRPVLPEPGPAPSDLPDTEAEHVDITAESRPQQTITEQDSQTGVPEPDPTHTLGTADPGPAPEAQASPAEPGAEHPSTSEPDRTASPTASETTSEPTPEAAPEAEAEEDADLSW
jgi:hypothetical protein